MKMSDSAETIMSSYKKNTSHASSIVVVHVYQVACFEQYNTGTDILRVPTDAIGGLSSVPISNRWWFLEKPLFCIYRFKD